MNLEATSLRLEEALKDISESFVKSYESFSTIKAKNQYCKDLPRIVNKKLRAYKDIIELTMEDLNSARLDLMQVLDTEEWQIPAEVRTILEETIGIHLEEEEAVGDATIIE